MADLSDVLTALATLAAGALYPAGPLQPSAVGVAVKVYPGWPSPTTLDADLRAAAPVCHVTIYAGQGERNTTRYRPEWRPSAINAPTLTLTAAGQTLTLAGTIPGASNPHNIMAMVNGRPYVYAVQASDTLASAAAALGVLIAAGVPGTTTAGTVITLPNSARLQAARVGVTGTAARELRRQEQRMQIAVWANTPANRDAIGKAVDSALAALTFITLPDNTAGRIRYAGNAMSDKLQKDCLFRRDLFYTVEYATTQTEAETQVIAEQLNVLAAVAGVEPYTAVATVYG